MIRTHYHCDRCGGDFPIGGFDRERWFLEHLCWLGRIVNPCKRWLTRRGPTNLADDDRTERETADGAR